MSAWLVARGNKIFSQICVAGSRKEIMSFLIYMVEIKIDILRKLGLFYPFSFT